MFSEASDRCHELSAHQQEPATKDRAELPEPRLPGAPCGRKRTGEVEGTGVGHARRIDTEGAEKCVTP